MAEKLRCWRKVEHSKLYGEDFIVFKPTHKVKVKTLDEPQGEEVRDIRVSKPYEDWRVKFATKFGRDRIEHFKSKPQALKFAKSYMKKHDIC